MAVALILLARMATILREIGDLSPMRCRPYRAMASERPDSLPGCRQRVGVQSRVGLVIIYLSYIMYINYP